MAMFKHKSTFGTAVAVILLLGGTVGCGGTERPEPQSGDDEFMMLGKRVYQQNCLACHQADGSGVPSIYPPLQQTKWVNGDDERLILLVLHGMEGPIEVKGVIYDQVMIPHDFLTDEQIAAVLTYVRSNFGNDAGAVTPERVAEVRVSSDRERRWTAEELLAHPSS